MTTAFASGDHALDPETARELVKSQFPQIEAATIECITGGWDFHVFLVGSRWVFRFPKRSESEAQLLKEFRVLGEVAASVSLAVPRYEFCGEPSRDYPYRFGGYPMIPGEPMMRLELAYSARAGLAAKLGGFVDSLHRFDPDRAMALGVPLLGSDGTIAAARSGALEDLEAIAEILGRDILQCCQQFFDDTASMPRDYDGPARLVHNDLGDEHVLVNPGTGELCGVIDWGDLALADPALDFTLWAWQDEGLVETMLNAYTLAVDPDIRDRIRYRGVCTAIGAVFFGREFGDQTYCEEGIAALRRMLG